VPARNLPAQPNLENLKKQAKRLHRRLKAGDPDAVSRVRAGLPRLSQTPESDIPSARVTLQEAQHVLAVEYGYANWKELLARTGDNRPMKRQPLRHRAHIRPSLQNLTQEAQRFMEMAAAGKGWAVPHIKRDLPRLADVPEEEIAQAGVTLEEARQVVAHDYGYEDWAELEADLGQLRPVHRFEDLADLEDDEIRDVIWRLGRDRLAVALKAVSDHFKDRFRTSMSDAEWQALIEAMEELGPTPLSEVETLQTEILRQYRSDDPLV